MSNTSPWKIKKIIWLQLFLLAVGYAFYSANRLSFGVGLKAVASQLALTTVQLGLFLHWGRPLLIFRQAIWQIGLAVKECLLWACWDWEL